MTWTRDASMSAPCDSHLSPRLDARSRLDARIPYPHAEVSREAPFASSPIRVEIHWRYFDKFVCASGRNDKSQSMSFSRWKSSKERNAARFSWNIVTHILAWSLAIICAARFRLSTVEVVVVLINASKRRAEPESGKPPSPGSIIHGSPAKTLRIVIL